MTGGAGFIPKFATAITARIWQLFAIAAGALMLFSGVLVWDLQRMALVRATIPQTERIERNLRTLADDLRDMESAQRGYLLTQDAQYLAPYPPAAADIPRRLDALRRSISEPQGAATVERIAGVVTARLAVLDRTVNLQRAGEHEAAMRIVEGGSGKRLMDEYRALSSAAIAIEIQQLDADRERVSAISITRLLWTIIGGGAATTVLLFAYSWSATRKLGQPIRTLVQGIQSVAAGALDQRLTISTRDEIGEIAAAFNVMTDQLAGAREAEAQALLELRRSHEELRASSEKLRIMVDGVKDYAIFMLDAEGRVATWNAAAGRLKGYREDEIIGQHVSILYPEADVLDGKPERALRIAADPEQGSIEEEGWRVRKDGSRYMANVVITAVRDAGGQLQGFIKASRDVTERNLATQEKHELHARLERIIAGMRDGLFEGSGVTTATTMWVSARFWEILGYRAGEMSDTVTGETLFAMLHPDDLARFNDAVGDPANARPTVSVEFRMRTAQGGWIWVHMRSTADVDPRDQTRRFRGLLQDISERKRAEERLARQEALLATTSRMAGVGGWEYEVAADRILWSETVFEICEWEAGEEPSTERGLELYPPDARRMVSAALSAAITEAKPFDLIVPFVTAKGRRRWVRALAEPECRDGRTVRLIGALQDVTEMRAAAEELRVARDAAESASRAKSDFLANMSHEIRTPLNGVIGMTGLLLETQLNSDQREFAEIARSSGESLLALINDILDFSKIESGSLELECIDFELRSVIDETVDAIALLASEKRLEVLVDIDLACPQTVRGDPTRLRQILLNLLSNAVKFTEAGDVTLTVSPSPAPMGRLALAVSVQDSGIGIAEDKIGKLFTPFTQADASTKRRHGGTGLGLSICRRLITAMGGTINLDSQPGRGTTFRFQILLDPSTHNSAGRQLPAHEPIRVLLVDDHPVNRRILTTQLRGWGAAVESADNAVECLIRWDALAAAGQVPQLAILDHDLPDHDGDWLGWQLRQRDSAGQCKLLLLSSLASHVPVGDRSPFDRSVAKPVKGDALFRLVSELTGGQSTPPATETTQAAEFQGLRALLVDDNPVNQKLGERLLVGMGFKVTQAWNGRQALEQLQIQRFEVVLMDCQMPEMDGYEATRALRRAGSGVLDSSVPVVAMTANALSGDRDRCLDAGMNDYVSKPINPTQLRAVLRKVMQLTSAAANSVPERGSTDESAVLDLDWLQAMFDGEPDFVADLLQTFSDCAQALMADIQRAQAQHDQASLKDLAHQLKGAAASVSAVELTRAAEALEHSRDDDERAARVEALQQAWNQLQSRLPSSHGSPNGAPHGSPNSSPNSSPNGSSTALPEGSPKGSPNGSPDSPPDIRESSADLWELAEARKRLG